MYTCSCRLSQLHSVGYQHDVTLQDEREQRHNEQMRMLHQRGSGIVVDASYTLCRYLIVYLNETHRVDYNYISFLDPYGSGLCSDYCHTKT